MLDVIIVGGGPAGLSAALVLGRCRRRVLVCDAAQPRNARADVLHGYLTRDGTPPGEFLRLARQELTRYPNVEHRLTEVIEAECLGRSFRARLASGEQIESRALVLATGVRDELPPLEGLEQFYGTSVHHCPYCDGWEWRDKPLAVYGKREGGLGLSAKLLNWSRDLVLCTDGPHGLSPAQHSALASQGVRIVTERIERLEGTHGRLAAIRFADGLRLAREALFLETHQQQASLLAARLGCLNFERRSVVTGEHQKTDTEGLYVVGDASRDVQMVIIAAAEGADAAFSINKYLMSHELPQELLV